MKNLSLSVVIALFASLLFSSCSKMSSLSISKRHYRSGYYVDLGGTKPQATTQQQRRVTAMPVIPPAVTASSESMKEPNPVEAVQTEATASHKSKEGTVKQSRKKATSEVYASAQDQQTTVEEIQGSALKSYTSTLPEVDPAAPAESSSVPFWLMIVFCIILPPLAVGLKFGITTEFWISLVLTLIFWIPGVIYALIMVID